ncbi:pro-neuregulin-3, membrane-bound isoform [Latimeria chalumnae]|uniref:pro-neuregulin-3, membrane-bound isoform n=1 Tax=Latimeria chalumnae TaxID=7897 RepID=UPI00313B9ED5
MSEGGASVSPPVQLSEPGEGAASGPGEEQDGGSNSREVVRCSGCIVWNRQQTWLCVVPLLIGFIGLGLSLMLLKWIVVGSVQDFVPTDLMDAKGIGQDPIFLSKPSSFPKSSETTTTTTTATASSNGAAAATTQISNRISTRITTTTRAPTRNPASGVTSQANPRTPTVQRLVTPTSTVPLTSTTHVARPLPGTATTQPVSTWPAANFSTSSSKYYCHDSAQSWVSFRFQDSKTQPKMTNLPKSSATTYSMDRSSEHFKPCRDKDLAYCLNDGDCFVIETRTGSHKHCRCKEGYQGVRCDQFLPKTDSILSDPTEHLGIEFMESTEMYQRQVLSITCITIGIVTAGLVCLVFYFRTRKQRQKIQESMKESRSGKKYSLNTSSLLIRSEAVPRNSIQLQNYSKMDRHSQLAAEKVVESYFSSNQPFPPAPSSHRGNKSIKHHRSPSSCCSHRQRNGTPLRGTFQRTPPIPRGRLNGVGGPAYQQLQEQGAAEKDSTSQQGAPSTGLKDAEYTFSNMQPSSRETHFHLSNSQQKDLAGYLSAGASSIPIIPSVGLDDSCMQVQKNLPEASGAKRCKNSSSTDLADVSTPRIPHPTAVAATMTSAAVHQEVEMLLETVQVQIQILAHARRKTEDCELEAREGVSRNTTFLPTTPLAKLERETQFLLKNETERDSAFTK